MTDAAVDFCYEDVVVGQEMRTRSRAVTAGDIADFARLTGDFHPLHTDDEFARSLGFPGRIAHGLFGLSLMEGIKTGLKLYEHTSVASLGWNNVRFSRPMFAGDVVHVRVRFTAKRESRNPDRGVVTEHVALVILRDAIVTEGEHVTLLLRRHAFVAPGNL